MTSKLELSTNYLIFKIITLVNILALNKIQI